MLLGAAQSQEIDAQSAPRGAPASHSHVSERDISVSFEFFPPKSRAMAERLWKTIDRLAPLNPDFVSVTYGAGGTTQAPTAETVERLCRETELNTAVHLTCVGSTRSEIDEIADRYWSQGVRHIVALRGDPVEGIGASYLPDPAGYAYASDLVAGLRRRHDFEVSVSAYPERHPESADWDTELDNLKRKVDAGATRAITQYFFSAETFLRFQDRVERANINIPVIAGIMLQPNIDGLKSMSSKCGIALPDWYSCLFDGLDQDARTRELLSASLATELVSELRARGVSGFHLYTLNRYDLALAVSRVLGLHLRQY